MLFLNVAAYGASCPYCGQVYGEGGDRDQAYIRRVRAEHEANCPARFRNNNPRNNVQPSQDDQAAAAAAEAQRQAAETARRAAEVEQQRASERKEAARKQAEFDKAKRDALSSMKGISDNVPGLKGVGSSDSFGLKGLGDSSANNPGLKGMDDPSLQLKDAVADSGVKTLFDKKRASQDLLSAKAHGITALDRAASILQGSASNPSLETSLEQAKAETDRRFSTRGKDGGQFDTVVLIHDSGSPQPVDNQPVPVPPEVAKDPRFQKLVVERDALDHQIEAAQQKLAGIKADSSYAQSTALLTEAYNQHNAVESLKVMRAYDEKQITKMVHLEPVDFGDDNTPPASKTSIDKIAVPAPAH
jgi:hypothetical protein